MSEQAPKKQRGRPRGVNRRRGEAESAFEQLELFQQWQRGVLPRLRETVAKAKSVEDIYKEFASDAAARAVMIAVTAHDPSKAMAAITEILNRSQGKPTEQVQLEHKYSKLRDEELDSLVLSIVNEDAKNKKAE